MNSPPFEYVNRKGSRYFLCETRTKNGKPRVVFAREPIGAPLATIPLGHEVTESVQGVVSLRKVGTCQIRREEVAIVNAVLARHGHLRLCKVDTRKRELIVYEPRSDGLDDVGRHLILGSFVIEALLERAPLMPVFRFTLDDAAKRTFIVQRMCYRGSMEGWLDLDGGNLEDLAARYLPHVGRESFYDLM